MQIKILFEKVLKKEAHVFIILSDKVSVSQNFITNIGSDTHINFV